MKNKMGCRNGRCRFSVSKPQLELHTTRSWDFMGFSEGQLPPTVEGEVIIGILDTGNTNLRRKRRKKKAMISFGSKTF